MKGYQKAHVHAICPQSARWQNVAWSGYVTALMQCQRHAATQIGVARCSCVSINFQTPARLITQTYRGQNEHILRMFAGLKPRRLVGLCLG